MVLKHNGVKHVTKPRLIPKLSTQATWGEYFDLPECGLGEVVKGQVIDAKVKKAGRRMVGSFEIVMGEEEDGGVELDIARRDEETEGNEGNGGMESPAVTRPNLNGVCKVGIKSCNGNEEERCNFKADNPPPPTLNDVTALLQDVPMLPRPKAPPDFKDTEEAKVFDFFAGKGKGFMTKGQVRLGRGAKEGRSESIIPTE